MARHNAKKSHSPNKKSSKISSTSSTESKTWHAVPLKSSFMLTAMLGFLISAYWVYPQSIRYGFSFMIVFAAMFIASLISMSKAPIMGKRGM
ncbi:MAG TPA: hypothetical protein VJI15_05700 [Candidatus Nanoarchaeia archaeon]|nr:hypothetical protein [Candidatus Nanoarchaeia archaeon]